VSVPLKETFWPTWIPGYPQTHNRFTLIKLTTDEGIEGYGAGSAMGVEREGLGVDANQGWLVTIVDKIPAWDLVRAKAFADACHTNGIEWLEEPLDSRDYDGNAELKKYSKVKISGAELNYGWDEIKIMFEKDCFHIYQPDATFAGGIAQVKRVIDMCHEKGRLYTPHTWTNGIGFYVNWNLVLADRENTLPLEYPYEPPSWIPQ